jgi:hypothetical protein
MKGSMNMVKENKNGIFTYKDESYDFNFKTSLSAYDKLVFVKTVVNTIVNDDSYDVVIKDLIFDFAIIDVFTNIDTSFINMKDEDGEDISSIILIEHFLEESNVVDIVKANMEDGLLDELMDAVDLNIQYLTGIKQNSIDSAITNLLSTLEKRTNDINLEDMMSMAHKFDSMTEDFTLENLVNAYMNSDIHKKNLEEIAEAKANVKTEEVEVKTKAKTKSKAKSKEKLEEKDK